MRFYDFCNFCTNSVLVFMHPVCYQFYYIFSSFVALSIRNISYFLSRINTFYTVTSTKYFFRNQRHKMLPSFETHHIYRSKTINISVIRKDNSSIINPPNHTLLVDADNVKFEFLVKERFSFKNLKYICLLASFWF